MNSVNNCDRQRLVGFLTNQLDVDDRLDFLGHLEACPRCWGEVYNARKAEHPHYYKSTARQVRMTDFDLRRIDADADEAEEAFQVA